MTVITSPKAPPTSRGIGKAVIYGNSIIVIYVVLGLIIAVSFASDFLK